MRVFSTGSETRKDMVKLLCDKGAAPSAKDDDGGNPLSNDPHRRRLFQKATESDDKCAEGIWSQIDIHGDWERNI